jgi:hypothetical protein
MPVPEIVFLVVAPTLFVLILEIVFVVASLAIFHIGSPACSRLVLFTGGTTVNATAAFGIPSVGKECCLEERTAALLRPPDSL